MYSMTSNTTSLPPDIQMHSILLQQQELQRQPELQSQHASKQFSTPPQMARFHPGVDLDLNKSVPQQSSLFIPLPKKPPTRPKSILKVARTTPFPTPLAIKGEPIPPRVVRERSPLRKPAPLTSDSFAGVRLGSRLRPRHGNGQSNSTGLFLDMKDRKAKACSAAEILKKLL